MSILEDAGRAWSGTDSYSSLFHHLQGTETEVSRHCSSPCPSVSHLEGQRSLEAAVRLHKEVWCESRKQEATGEQMKGFMSVLNFDNGFII